MSPFEEAIATIELTEAGARSALGQAILTMKAQLAQRAIGAASTRAEPVASREAPAVTSACDDAREPVTITVERPIVGWAVAADILGVSTDTLGRRRAARTDKSTAWWASRAALTTWWMKLIACEAAPIRTPRARATKLPIGNPNATEADLSREVTAIVKAARDRRR